MPLALTAEALSFSYGGRKALSQVSLSLGVGATVLLGRNGAGKTTLIRPLAGAARPDEGVVRLGNDPLNVSTRSGRRLLGRVGWLPQDFGYPHHMKVVEFVAYAAWLKEVPKGKLTARVSAALAAADVTELASRPMRSLSGGQRRRAGLAAAVVADPEVVVLDEPTAGLDPEQRDDFHTLIRGLRRTKTVVIATHLLEDVDALADRVVIVEAGQVLWEGTRADLAGAAQTDTDGVAAIRQGLRRVLGDNR